MSVTMTAEYTGQLHCQIFHGPSGARLETDAPQDNMGLGASFSPTDLVGAAFLSCAITTMAIKAAKEGIRFTRARGTVIKEMTREGPRMIEGLTLHLELPEVLSLAHRARLEEFARTCPVALSLSLKVALPIQFHYLDF